MIEMTKTKTNIKKGITALLAAALLFAFTGCGGNPGGSGGSGSDTENTVIDMDKLALELQEGIEFKDSMSEVDSSVFYMLYGLTEEDADTEVMICSTGATAEEITIIHAAAPDKTKTILEATDAHVEAQREGFENYVPAEMDKLSDPVIKQIGDYIILCISDDNKKAEEIINQYK